MLGTPCYLSPEQAQGHELDARSDQYSLAVLGYQMFVGRLPLVAGTAHVLLYKHIYEIPVPAQTARREVPAEISRALQRALAKKPEQRFDSMAEFAAAVWPERAAREGAVPEGPAQATRRKLSRRRTALLATGAAVLAIAGIAVAMLRGIPGERPSPPAPVRVSADSATNRPESVAAPVAELESATAPPPQTSEPKPRPTPPARRPARPARQAPETTFTTRPAAPSVGYLTINAVPYGAVVLDGVEVGDTPIVRYELSPGEHAVRIVRQGYRTESESVSITGGNEIRLSRTLVKETR